MNFEATAVSGLMVVSAEAQEDDRGSFVRAFCEEESAGAGAPFQVRQANLSQNRKRGTLRGLHYQDEPRPDPKMVRCVRGAVWDVAVDLRPPSPSFLKWFGCELSAENRKAMLVPAGCAHGFLTLSEDSELLYLMAESYVAELARGVRWDDPAFGIEWPLPVAEISSRDASWPDFVRQP